MKVFVKLFLEFAAEPQDFTLKERFRKFRTFLLIFKLFDITINSR